MKIADFSKVVFQLVSKEPLIVPPRFTPLIADPSFLLPTQTTDGKWHLFAHSALGIQQFISDNGIDWKKKALVRRAALRPFIFKENDTYYLFYEKYQGLKLLFSFLPGQRWYSEIEMMSSKDLQQWSSAKVLIHPCLDFHKDKKLGAAVSNPCLVKMGNKYRLYFSSSLVRVPDCGFNEPLHITYAESDAIDGDYVCNNQACVSPAPTFYWNNLGAGSMKVLACEDGFVAFQNGIYEHEGKSGSAICLLCSKDGNKWEYLHEQPILQPDPDISWMASHIYACDAKVYDGKIWLYFNARNHAHWSKGSEHIGLAISPI